MVKIVEVETGIFMLKKYVVRYDDEEDVAYMISDFPNPPSKYGEISTAIAEARRLLRIWD